MRICLLTLDFPPFRSSGLTIYAETIARGLAARGHGVTVVASQRRERDQVGDARAPQDVRVVRLPVGSFDWVAFGWRAARFLHASAHEYDVVHFADVHFAYACKVPFIASAFQSFRQRRTSRRGQPYHVSWRDYLFRLAYYTVARWAMETPALRRARRIIMPSVATQREFVGHYGVDEARTSLIYPGIDTQRFGGARPDRSTARQQLGLPSDMAVLLYVGFSTPRKGLEYLAEAVGVMETPVQLVMVGKWEGGYQERFLRNLGIERSRVRITGYVPDDILLDYYAAVDAFVLPTLLEGFGFPLAEAMAAGVPVVTTTGGSAAEVVGECGLTVSPSDSGALASALDELLGDPELARRFGNAGRRRARALFDQGRFCEEIEKEYERVACALPG
jgi:glycosyltransferase involved in cell wall biosynthesis